MQRSTELMITGHRMKKLYISLCDKLCRKYDITQLELEMLVFIADNPDLATAGNIVKNNSVAKSHVSRAAEDLIVKGLLDRSADQHDRRVLHMRLTDRAAEIVRQAADINYYFCNAIYKDFSDEELERFHGFLERIYDNMQRIETVAL